MSGKRAAIRYAKAILSLAQENNSLEGVNNDMILITKTVSESQDLEEMLSNSVIKIADKKAVLLKVFPQVSEITKQLFNVLSDNKRIDLLNRVAKSFDDLYKIKSGKQEATVTTAFPITKELTALVLEKTKQFTDKKVELTNVIDEEILGGFILRIGDLQYNASVASKLNKLKREFTLN